jgi:hypothetical protein
MPVKPTVRKEQQNLWKLSTEITVERQKPEVKFKKNSIHGI